MASYNLGFAVTLASTMVLSGPAFAGGHGGGGGSWSGNNGGGHVVSEHGPTPPAGYYNGGGRVVSEHGPQPGSGQPVVYVLRDHRFPSNNPQGGVTITKGSSTNPRPCYYHCNVYGGQWQPTGSATVHDHR